MVISELIKIKYANQKQINKNMTQEPKLFKRTKKKLFILSLNF